MDTHAPMGAEAAHADSWFALHVFLSDPAEADRFLLGWAGPRLRTLLREGQARRWFFLRYWEGGPHLRLRVQGLAPAARDALAAEARAAAARHANPKPPARDAYYRHHFFDGQPLDPATLPWFEEASVYALPYAPEWRRYGGLHGLPVNESLFDLSSTVALGLVRASAGDPARRLALAAGLMPVFALAWQPGLAGVLRFLDDYVAYWSASSPQVRAFAAPAAPPSAAQCEQLRRTIETPPNGDDRTPAALLAAGLDAAVAQWNHLRAQGLLVSPITGAPVAGEAEHRQALQAMLASQLHMLNNRLGLAPLQEVVLARHLVQAARALVRERLPETATA